MEYNLKEQLIDKIGGLKLLVADRYGAEYNKGVGASITRVDNFFNDELIPEVPQFVANWYEKHKNNFNFHVWDYVYMFDNKDESDFTRWLNDSNVNAFQTLVNMHQFGYKVKEEKKYIVKMLGLLNNLSYLNYDSIDDEWYFNDADNGNAVGTYHTKKQLEDAGFSNVFDNPMFEVKEIK